MNLGIGIGMGMIVNPALLGAAGGGGGATDPDIASVKLLVGFNGTNGSTTFTDESPSARTLTANGNAQISTTSPKFGSGCGLFDGTGDYISAADSADWAMGSGDFTVEMWVNLAVTNAGAGLAVQWGGSLGGSGMLFRIESQKLIMEWGNISVQAASSSLTWTANTWYHVAYDRSGGNQYLYRSGDGQLFTSAVSGTMADAAAAIRFGGANVVGTDLNGKLDEIRITKGVARYAGSYTAPTAAFPRS